MSVVDGPDNVTITPSSSDKEKSPFQLTCSANCVRGCQSYVWFYSKSMTPRTPILNFPSLSKEDSGNYLCRVTDDFGWTNSKYYTLNVKCKPRFFKGRLKNNYGFCNYNNCN